MEAKGNDERIRILIADDSTEFRQGLSGLLEGQPDMEVIGEAVDGEAVISIAAKLLPDVILMDLQMPGINGIEATRQLTTTSPHIGVLVITMFEDDDSVFAAMRAGARGYLLKGARKTETLRAIRAVADGEAIFSPTIARRLMRFFSRPTVRPFPELTDREREVLTQIAQGRDNATIASLLFLSQKTVRNHVSNIYSKLQVADRTQAALLARDAGMVLQSSDLTTSERKR